MVSSQGVSKRFGYATFLNNKEADRFISECDKENIVDKGGYIIKAS
jgi:hypothetical protein